MSNYTPALYADITALLAGGDVSAPKPSIGARTDNARLFYAEAVNTLIGQPESAKTLTTQAVMAQVMTEGGSCLFVDIDHNGAASVVSRLRGFLIDDQTLKDPEKFRYAAPEDATEMLAIVAEAAKWNPTLVVVDSVGELMVLFGANSNLPDDYTRVHRAVLTALAKTGACVIAIDHEAKSADSAAYGASGTAAKKRAVDGVMLRATIVKAFTPGEGGKSRLSIVKDRHGGARAATSDTNREPALAMFTMKADGSFTFHVPRTADEVAAHQRNSDLQQLMQLVPAPSSVRDVKTRCGWRTERAADALREYRSHIESRAHDDTMAFPVPTLKGGEQGNTKVVVPGEPWGTGGEQGTERCEKHDTPTLQGQCGRCLAEQAVTR